MSAHSSTVNSTAAAIAAPQVRRVRLWHFVVLPALAMAAVLLLARVVEALILDQLGPVGVGVYQASRTVLISLVMASVIGWLALVYRRQYESRLELRNKVLEETRDFLHGIIEGCGEAIITLNADERITSWNPAAERIFGWTAAEMLGQTYQRLLPADPRFVEERRRVSDSTRSGETVRDYQTTRLRKDGTPVTLRVTWSPMYDRAGAYAGVTAIVLDITAENEMKQRLVEQERLAALGELATQVAHEVRNPLAGIRGACEVILDGRADEASREVGEEVLRQIDRLNRTVTELLDFARPRAIAPEKTDVNRLIERVVTMFREDPSARALAVDSRLARDLPQLDVDRGQIEQVFYNLLLNAAQVLEHRGTIRIATERSDAHVAITVSDTGPGIAPEVAPNIFKPFFSTRSQGTGLGLTIVKKIVEAHSGTVEAGSAPGGGAEFRIRLPLPGQAAA